MKHKNYYDDEDRDMEQYPPMLITLNLNIDEENDTELHKKLINGIGLENPKERVILPFYEASRVEEMMYLKRY